MSEKIVFINASQNRDGNTAHLGEALLKGRSYEQVNLVDYKIYQIGQDFPDDQFEEVLDKIKRADVVIFGTPTYWHEMSGYLKTLIERIGQLNDSSILKNIKDALLMQGAFPGDGVKETAAILNRFSSVVGMKYVGDAENLAGLESLRKKLEI